MHPILFNLGPLAIHTYGVLVAFGFVLGIAIAGRRAQAVGIEPERISDLGVWLIVAGMLGGKLFYILFYWRDFSAAFRADGLSSLREGFVFYGGFIVAAVTGMTYARVKRLPLGKLADVVAPSIALGHAFGRLGCFSEGCCYGSACALPWAVHFPAPHPMHNIPVHPAQLYEAAGNLVLFAGLSVLLPRKRFAGQVWWLYVIGYAGLRFGVEFFRGDYLVHYFGLLTTAQLLAAGLLVIGLAGYNARRQPQ